MSGLVKYGDWSEDAAKEDSAAASAGQRNYMKLSEGDNVVRHQRMRRHLNPRHVTRPFSFPGRRPHDHTAGRDVVECATAARQR